jgi:hypothetical protein
MPSQRYSSAIVTSPRMPSRTTLIFTLGEKMPAGEAANIADKALGR